MAAFALVAAGVYVWRAAAAGKLTPFPSRRARAVEASAPPG